MNSHELDQLEEAVVQMNKQDDQPHVTTTTTGGVQPPPVVSMENSDVFEQHHLSEEIIMVDGSGTPAEISNRK